MADMTAGVVLRPGTVADVPGLCALGAAVVPPTYFSIDAAYGQRMLDEWWTPELFTALLARMPHVVADHDGQVVGVANVGPSRVRDEDREVMFKLYVHPDHQGTGLGGRLLADAEELVAGDALWLEVIDGNEAAYGFYRAHGFEEVERATNEPWPDDIWLCKKLGKTSDEAGP